MRATTSILNSALKHGNSLKRLVLTSSVTAVREDPTVPRTFSESNWNDAAVEAVKTKGPAAGPYVIYSASKVLAEKAAWEFVAAHESEISWDLVTINPPWIFGVSLFILPNFFLTVDVSPHVMQPSLGPAPTVDDINVSQREIYDTLSGVQTRISALLGGQGTWVHVAVAAEAHVRATHAPAAGGHRIIVRSGPFFYQDIRKFYIPFVSYIR